MWLSESDKNSQNSCCKFDLTMHQNLLTRAEELLREKYQAGNMDKISFETLKLGEKLSDKVMNTKIKNRMKFIV